MIGKRLDHRLVADDDGCPVCSCGYRVPVNGNLNGAAQVVRLHILAIYSEHGFKQA